MSIKLAMSHSDEGRQDPNVKRGPIRFHLGASRKGGSAKFVARHHSSFPENGVLLRHREKRMGDEWEKKRWAWAESSRQARGRQESMPCGQWLEGNRGLDGDRTN